MRHSEAEDLNPKYSRDIDRPLTERGVSYAKKLGENLKTIAGEEWTPTRIICSSAKRTKETLVAMDLECMKKKKESATDEDGGGDDNAVLFLGSATMPMVLSSWTK